MRCSVLVLVSLLAAACQSPTDAPKTGAKDAEPTKAGGAEMANEHEGEAAKPENTEPENLEPGDKTVLLELYTSQGCDSCPKADAFIGTFPELGWSRDKVVPLTFHVTYWDDLGWSDPYGAQLFDQRQIGYAQTVPGAKADDENTIKGPYTPQIVVDGKIHFSGTLADVAKREVAKASRAAMPIEIELATKVQAPSADAGSTDAERVVAVDVRSRLSPTATARGGLDTDKSKVGLFAALTQKHVQTEVPRGENAGKKLDEYGVVRHFAGPKLFRSSRANETHFELPIPVDANPEDLDVVVFAQDLASLGIHAVVSHPVAEPKVAAAAGME